MVQESLKMMPVCQSSYVLSYMIGYIGTSRKIPIVLKEVMPTEIRLGVYIGLTVVSFQDFVD
jgi:hypothetical protein